MNRTGKTKIYVELVKYKCLHPDCKSGSNIEVHHIIPIKQGGADEYWNLISLCRKCHRSKKLHIEWESKIVELYNYKSYFELEMFGFVLDDYKKTPKQVKDMLYDARAQASDDNSLIVRIRNSKKSQRMIAKEYGNKITCADISRIKKGVVPTSPKKREALGVRSEKKVPFCQSCDHYHDGECRPKKKPGMKIFDAKKFIFENVFDVKYDAGEFRIAALKLSPFQRKSVKDLWINSYAGITQETINRLTDGKQKKHSPII